MIEDMRKRTEDLENPKSVKKDLNLILAQIELPSSLIESNEMFMLMSFFPSVT